MNKKISKKNIIISLAIVFLAITIISVAIFYRLIVTKSNAILSTKDNSLQPASQNLSAQDEGLNSKDQNIQTEMSQKLAKPILIKSSGNNGPVPLGSIVNFTCSWATENECFIEMEDNSNKSNKIILQKKIILRDRGQGFASWDWTAVLGKWDIKAIIIDKEGNISASEPQNLEVIR